MDNEAIVDQIVRSLSFEVFAVPQDVVRVNSTSKSTPLNIKIKVRKKNDARFRHGVLSMPKVEREEKGPQRIRLVSSDHTIMSFNVLMDADFERVTSKDPKQDLKMVTAGLCVRDDIDNNPNRSKITDTSPILSKRNKDIFGRCKPGGCLDPPFGEDKYSYRPHQNLLPATKDDSAKLRTSSIFKNKLFKRKKKSSQDEELYKSDIKTSTAADSILSLYKKGSLENPIYSNSIITYPHPSNSRDMRTPEKSNKTKYSSEEKSIISVLEDNGSYFIIPKKAKKISKEIDSVKNRQIENLKFIDDTLKPVNNNILQTMPEPNEDLKSPQIEIHEAIHSSKIHNFVPISLFADVKDGNKDFKTLSENTKKSTQIHPSNLSIKIEAQTEIKIKESAELTDYISQITNDQTELLQKYLSNSNIENIPDETLDSRVTLTLPDIRTLNYTDDLTNTSSIERNNRDTDTDLTVIVELVSDNPFAGATDTLHQKMISDPQIVKNISQQSFITESTLLNKIQDVENDKSDLNLSRLSAINQNVIPLSINDMDLIMDDNNCLDVNTGDQEDISDDDVVMKIPTKTLLVTDRDKSLLAITSDETTAQNPSDLADLSGNENSAEDLQLIWKNDTLPLKFTADVITKSTMPAFEENPLPTLEETFLSADDHLKHVSSSIPKSDEIYLQPLDDHMKQKDVEILRGTIPVSESETRTINILGQNSDDGKTPEILDNYDTSSDDINDIIDRNNETKENNLPENIESTKLLDETNSAEMAGISSNLGVPSDNIKEQTMIDCSDNDDFIKSDTQDNLKVNALTSFTEDEITSEDLNKLEDIENILTESILPKENLKCNVNDVSNYQDNETLKRKMDGELAKTGNIEYKLDLPESIDRSNLFIERVKPDLATQNYDIDNAVKSPLGVKQFHGEDLSRVLLNHPKSATEPRQGLVPWKMDIGLLSYTNENNERVIKSFNTENVPGRRQNDTVVVAQCSLEGGSNEIKIPIDHEYNLCIQIINNVSDNPSVSDLNVNVTNDELHEKKKIQMTQPDSDAEEKYSEDINASKANKHNKTSSRDIRDVLITVYEKELVPLHEIIKGLREEIEMLAAHEIKFREKAIQKLGSKKTKPIRLVHGNKKCPCTRRL